MLQILSPTYYASAPRLLRAENLYAQYTGWALVEFRSARLEGRAPEAPASPHRSAPRPEPAPRRRIDLHV